MSTDPLSRYYAGAQPQQFTPAEAEMLAAELMTRPEYSNHRHRLNGELSRDVQALWKRAAPGYIGPGGEVVGS